MNKTARVECLQVGYESLVLNCIGFRRETPDIPVCKASWWRRELTGGEGCETVLSQQMARI